MILHKCNAKHFGVFSLFSSSSIFIFTPLAINYSPKLWHPPICHYFHHAVYSFHRKTCGIIRRVAQCRYCSGDRPSPTWGDSKQHRQGLVAIQQLYSEKSCIYCIYWQPTQPTEELRGTFFFHILRYTEIDTFFPRYFRQSRPSNYCFLLSKLTEINTTQTQIKQHE